MDSTCLRVVLSPTASAVVNPPTLLVLGCVLSVASSSSDAVPPLTSSMSSSEQSRSLLPTPPPSASPRPESLLELSVSDLGLVG